MTSEDRQRSPKKRENNDGRDKALGSGGLDPDLAFQLEPSGLLNGLESDPQRGSPESIRKKPPPATRGMPQPSSQLLLSSSGPLPVHHINIIYIPSAVLPISMNNYQLLIVLL